MSRLTLLSFAAFLILSSPLFSTAESAGVVSTKTICPRPSCPRGSVLRADNWRVIGNRADKGFKGWMDVWTNRGASVFATNIVANSQTAWPRISEGCTDLLAGAYRTPGYPIRVASITRRSAKRRLIVFSTQWTRRNNGPKPRGSSRYPRPRGKVKHGVYMWFNNPRKASQWQPYPIPKWPFELEVNVWNRADGGGYRRGATRFADYYDNDGQYQVRGHDTCHKGDCFYAYYVTLVRPRRSRNKVNININKLLRHLKDNTWNGKKPPALKSYYELIETSIAAEADAKTDAKFIATISTMGR